MAEMGVATDVAAGAHATGAVAVDATGPMVVALVAEPNTAGPRAMTPSKSIQDMIQDDTEESLSVTPT